MDRQTGQEVTAERPWGGDGPPPKRRLTRREAIKYGLLATAGLSAGGWLLHRLLRSGGAVEVAEVFSGDAPTGRLWRQWVERGWAKEGYHYLRLGRNVRCRLCPNNCLLRPEDRGRCRVRVNKGGVLYTLAYGNPCSFHVDPMEKKPLFHFLPGTRIFSIATAGCGFRCLNCQNWDISQRKPEETKDPRGEELRLAPKTLGELRRQDVDRLSIFPSDVVALAEHLNCSSVAYTYSEPTVFFEYMYDTAKLARSRKVHNVWVTCGYIQPKALADLCRYIDAANVDLKGFDDGIYRKLNSGRLQPVLDTLKALKARGVWFEVTNLVVPTYTDKMDMIRRMCGWLIDNLGPDVPLHFSRFHPQHKLTYLPPTPAGVLTEARSIAQQVGLRYVYIGNIRGVPDAERTFCPKCKKPIVERDVFSVTRLHLKAGRCAYCGAKIAGVWSA